MTTLIDCDNHLFEPADMWERHLPASQKDLALRIAEGDLGYEWLMHGDRRLGLVEPHRPGAVGEIGKFRQRARAGLPNDEEEGRQYRAEYGDPAARLRHLDEEGFEAGVLFPNYGLLWERPLAPQLPAVLANMSAWNRWAAEVYAAGNGRLHPVAHLTLRDPDWFEAELGRVAAAGLRLGFIAPGLVDGKPLSSPELDRVWAAFEANHVAPVFHVANQERPFAAGWYDSEDDQDLSVLQSIFLWTAPALAITDMILGGVFERHPDLRVGIMELSAPWVPLFLMYLDGGVRFTSQFNGTTPTGVAMVPSDYFRRQVRVAAFSYERPDALSRKAGDLFMACSDYPHTEGTAHAVADYRAIGLDGEAAPGLFRDNIRFLLHEPNRD